MQMQINTFPTSIKPQNSEHAHDSHKKHRENKCEYFFSHAHGDLGGSLLRNRNIVQYDKSGLDFLQRECLGQTAEQVGSLLVGHFDAQTLKVARL